MKVFFKSLLLVTLMFAVSSCSNENDQLGPNEHNPKFLTSMAIDNGEGSTTLGNFAATAVKVAHKIDFVFLPTDYFQEEFSGMVDLNMSPEEIQKVVNIFEAGPTDDLLIGSMKGKNIKKFIIDRSREYYRSELESAGLWYHVGFEGGLTSFSNFLVEGRYKLEDDRVYTIAVSDDYYFGTAFPGYKFRNGFNFTFRRIKKEASLRGSIKTYLETAKYFPNWQAKRAQVSRSETQNVGFKKINQIQGSSHASPLINKVVRTRGVITAYSTPDLYPWGTELYIESINPDRNNQTSEGLHVKMYRLDTFGLDLKIGDYIEITGTVFEDIRGNGLGDTILRFVSGIKLIEENATSYLPPAVELSRKKRAIPTRAISTYGGRLMEKTYLNLSDGIDFWESLEGMRVKINDFVVLGFRGGREDYYDRSVRSYLNLYITPSEFMDPSMVTHKGGLMLDHPKGDFNPEIFSMITDQLTDSKNINEERIYTVGDHFKGEVEGVLTYNRNIFNGGEYALVVPTVQESLVKNMPKRKELIPLKERPITTLKANADNEITIGTYNLENLSAFQVNRAGEDRMVIMADSISTSMKCPDIVNLVEIQDNNGMDLRGTQTAEITLRKLRALTQSSCLEQDYEFVEIEPFLHGEGGQPGGNIRVSVLFNSKKLSIDYRSDGAYGSPAILNKNGLSANNPGRIYPHNEAFARSRRSLFIEFGVKAVPGEKIYLIGNHLNSKLGDVDFWGNQQIARANSDDSRGRKTALINKFIHWLQGEKPNANIVVLGDFNALASEDSMKVLTDKEQTLQNMMFTLPKNERYTTSHNGNSQPLDYIFVNTHITKTKKPVSEVLHINSDYMGKLSDHDPVMLKLTF